MASRKRKIQQAVDEQETTPEVSQKKSKNIIEPRSTEGGQIYACGQGDSGQLGLGNLLEEDEDSTGEIYWPKRSSLPGSPEVRQVAAGGMHSVSLTMTGDVYTTGVNDEGALGRKTDTKIWQESGLSGDVGDSYRWDQVDIPHSQGKIIEVSAGDSHTMALTEKGAVWGWGCFRGSSGPFGFQPGVEIALRPMLVYQPHDNTERVVSISSGADHVLALRQNGTVLSWGFGEQGQLGRLGRRVSDPKRMLLPALVPLKNVAGFGSRRVFRAVAIAAASYGSFAVAANGVLAAFGVNVSGQLGLPVQGGTVEENVIPRPTAVGALQWGGVKTIAAGKAHTLVLTDQQKVVSFGLQTYGRLGRQDADSASDSALPAGVVDNLSRTGITSVVAGHDTSAAVTDGGDALVWGMGTNYQLARGENENDANVPYKVKREKIGNGVAKVLQVAFGGQHTLLLAKP